MCLKLFAFCRTLPSGIFLKYRCKLISYLQSAINTCLLHFKDATKLCITYLFYIFPCRGPVLQRIARQDTQLRAVEGQQRYERRQGKGEIREQRVSSLESEVQWILDV